MSEEKLTADTVRISEFLENKSVILPDQKDDETETEIGVAEMQPTGFIELANNAVSSAEDDGEGGATYVDMNQAGTVAQTMYVAESLPEGYTMVLGDDGQQYVTIVQDNQTYAIPLSEYQAMQQSGATAFAIQTTATVVEEEMSNMIVSATGIQAAHIDLAALHQQQHQLQQFAEQAEESAASSLPLPETQEPTQKSAEGVGIRWGMSGGPQSQIKPPAKPAIIQQMSVDTRTFKPIRVDNWGIFLLSRLQAYFQKKEHCDLTLRFPSRNAQIKVHKLVVNACTDYFMTAEREGRIVDGAIDFPETLLPEAVAPIIRFMYTGRLDVKTGMFSKLQATASYLQMSVLTKLMDAQLNAPIVEPSRKNLKRKKGVEDDPVRQIKKIRRIEKKFSEEERKSRMAAAKLEAQRNENSETLPGKKLPIWKRKVPPEMPGSSPSGATVTTNGSTQVVLTPVSGPPSVGSKPAPPKASPRDLQREEALEDLDSSKNLSTARASYGKQSPESEKPKVPRQIREIQQNLTFEKIRRTGTKNNTGASSSSSSSSLPRDMSVEEIKEFMEEQRKRLQHVSGDGEYFNEDDDDDDYYDNDAEMDYGDDPDEEEEDGEAVTSSPTRHSNKNQASVTPTSRPILKQQTPLTTPTSMPRKSVRFSLRPASAPTQKEPLSEEKNPRKRASTAASTPTTPTTPTSTAPKKRGRPSLVKKGVAPKKEVTDTLDKTLDEFSRALQEEEQKEKVNGETMKSPSVTPTRTPSRFKKKSKNMAAPAIKSESVSQMKIVNEILKRNPDLLKDNKTVKVKVMVKNSEGKPVYKYITLRPQQTATVAASLSPAQVANAAKSPSEPLNASLGLRDVPKVCYTGKRGRPKTIKPGEFDPHELERRTIEAQLHKKIAKLSGADLPHVPSTPTRSKVTEGTPLTFAVDIDTDKLVTGSSTKSLKPSTEAEALSNVATGIATSLGLVAEAALMASSSEFHQTENNETSTGPLSDLEHYGGEHQFETFVVEAVKATVVKEEQAVDGKAKEVVSQLAMDWDDDEEDAS